jgi:hypothetical protein
VVPPDAELPPEPVMPLSLLAAQPARIKATLNAAIAVLRRIGFMACALQSGRKEPLGRG